ncbi:MAG: membrane protein insertion efficiency factor YidD [Cyanobacteria bacterium P01_D01_bin.156]
MPALFVVYGYSCRYLGISVIADVVNYVRQAVTMKTTSSGVISATLNKILPLSIFLEKRGLRSIISQLVSRLIKVYQRYLSPYKGFSCAHRAVHGGPSCSAYFSESVVTHGVASAIPLFRQRLGDCRQAYYALKTSASKQSLNEPNIGRIDSSDERSKGKAKRDSRHLSQPIDWCSGSYCDCGVIDIPNWGPCDTNSNGACDAGDCSGSDLFCDGCDVGSGDCNW